jgi:hypothetical protein
MNYDCHERGETRTAERFLAAARTLRERAATATPGLWQHMCLGSEGCLVLRRHGTLRERGRGRIARMGSRDWQADHADAEYVAMMAPPVAEALAAWLEVKAANPSDHDYGYALALADAVNPATPETAAPAATNQRED